jgi:hypothetical protein
MSALNYGSVEGQAESKSFDEKDTYYLKESTLSPEDRRRKCMRMAVPIILAVVIIGGFALFLLRDFEILYPGRSGGNNKVPSDPLFPIGHTTGTDQTSEKQSDPTPQLKPNPSPPSDAGKNSGMASSCFAHKNCDGLVGECCPTLDGVFLLCCN